MRVLAELLLFPVMGPVRGVEFVVKQIQAELEAQLMNEERVRAAIAELSLQHTLGEISEEEYQEREEELFEELEAIRAYEDGLTEEYLSLDPDEEDDDDGFM